MVLADPYSSAVSGELAESDPFALLFFSESSSFSSFESSSSLESDLSSSSSSFFAPPSEDEPDFFADESVEDSPDFRPSADFESYPALPSYPDFWSTFNLEASPYFEASSFFELSILLAPAASDPDLDVSFGDLDASLSDVDFGGAVFGISPPPSPPSLRFSSGALVLADYVLVSVVDGALGVVFGELESPFADESLLTVSVVLDLSYGLELSAFLAGPLSP